MLHSCCRFQNPFSLKKKKKSICILAWLWFLALLPGFSFSDMRGSGSEACNLSSCLQGLCADCAQTPSSLQFTPCAIWVTGLSLRIMFLAGEERGNWGNGMTLHLLCYHLTGSSRSHSLASLPFKVLPQAACVFAKLFLPPATPTPSLSTPWLLFDFCSLPRSFLRGFVALVHSPQVVSSPSFPCVSHQNTITEHFGFCVDC